MIKPLYRDLLKPFYLDIQKTILDTLFPISCLVCETEGEFVCSYCLSKLAKVENQICIVCRKPSPFGFTHPSCTSPHGADGLISILNYKDDNVAKIVIHGKYFFIKDVYKILAQPLAQKIQADYQNLFSGKYSLAPVPLASSRKRWRGFNQAEVMCETLSEHLGLEIKNALRRQKATKTQKDLKREQRIKNVEGCFALAKDFDAHEQSFLLVDDVTTTGSTLLEAVKVLKRNGANQVWCLTVARD